MKAAVLEGVGGAVPLENQPEVFRSGDKKDGFFRVVSGAVNPMIVTPKTDDVPGSFFKRHECDVRGV